MNFRLLRLIPILAALLTLALPSFAATTGTTSPMTITGYNVIQTDYNHPQTAFLVGNNLLGLYWTMNELPANSQFRMRYQRPDSSIAFDQTIDANNPYYSQAWYWYVWWVNLDVPGQWHLLLDINGTRMVNAAFTVRVSFNTLNVPSQYSTIQAAINAAQPGDTVLVGDGTYAGNGNRDLDFGGKDITVRSAHGAASCTIDCQGGTIFPHRGFSFHGGETPTATVDGFTITNGQYDAGGGTSLSYSSPTITNCVFSGNIARGQSFGYGGAVFLDHSNAKFVGCAFNNNTASYPSTGDGGALNMTNSAPTLMNCSFSGNVATASGGALSVYISNPTITNCTFSGNTGQSGGAMNLNASSPTVTNCSFSNNSANSGRALNLISKSFLVAANTIIVGNSGSQIASDQTSSLTASFSDIQGGYPGTGNINVDPQFANAAGDLHLNPGSPCLGTGNANGAPATDLDGRTRPNPPSMGAYELAKFRLKDGFGNEVVGIVCDNLSGMDDNDAAKDKLVISLDYPAITGLTGTVTAAGSNTNDTGYVKTLSDGKTYYFPPDEYNENQVPQNVTQDITRSATRTVTLTLHFTSNGTPYTVTKSIILARPPVVLVHGINNNPSNWNPFIASITGMDANGNQYTDATSSDRQVPIAVVPFVTLNHSDPTSFSNGLDDGNEPVELGALLLSERIAKTITAVRAGDLITDHDENTYNIDPATNEQHTFDGYLHKSLSIRRVDVVAWSYGGVIARWYLERNKPPNTISWYQRPFLYVRNVNGTTYTYSNASSSGNFTNTNYNSDVRKLITLGSMWRGVPLANYLNEDTFAEENNLTNGVNFHNAPGLAAVVGTVRALIPTNVSSLEVMAIKSKWLSQLIYSEPNPTLASTPAPFDFDVAYGSVAGDDNAYEAGSDLNVLVDYFQNPSWFPYLQLEFVHYSDHAYTDGLVPLWSAAIPEPDATHKAYTIVHSVHSGYAANAETQNYVTLSLNSSLLPIGDSLNSAWQNPDVSKIQSYDGTKTWTMKPSEMAPHAENDLYQQVNGVGRINPIALKEINTARVTSVGSSSATLLWQTATDMDSEVKLYQSSSFIANTVQDVHPLTPMKNHQITLTGLQPNTTYYYEVVSTLFNPPVDGNGNYRDIVVGTNLYKNNHQLSFRTSPAQQPIISVSVLGPNSSAHHSFILAITNKGGDASNLTVQGVAFSVSGYTAIAPLPTALIIQNGQTVPLTLNYNAGATSSQLLCRVTYQYKDGNGNTIPATTSFLRIY